MLRPFLTGTPRVLYMLWHMTRVQGTSGALCWSKILTQRIYKHFSYVVGVFPSEQSLSASSWCIWKPWERQLAKLVSRLNQTRPIELVIEFRLSTQLRDNTIGAPAMGNAECQWSRATLIGSSLTQTEERCYYGIDCLADVPEYFTRVKPRKIKHLSGIKMCWTFPSDVKSDNKVQCGGFCITVWHISKTPDTRARECSGLRCT